MYGARWRAWTVSVQHTWRTTWANNRNKGPGTGRAQSGRPQPSWSERARPLHWRSKPAGREWATTTGPDRTRSFGRDVTCSLHSNCCLKLMHLWSEQTDRHTHTRAIMLQGADWPWRPRLGKYCLYRNKVVWRNHALISTGLQRRKRQEKKQVS